jgi:type IV pilus assembly protein PilV
MASRNVARARAYTAVEVLVSLAVLAVGAAGVIAMQRTAIRGDVDVRKLDVANEVARTATERLRLEADRWTASAPPDGWFLPERAAFDAFGRDLGPAEREALVYCVNVRLATLAPGALARADVRVVWARDEAGVAGDWCTPARMDAMKGALDEQSFHAVSVTTALRRSPAP